jgi:hypothetical protein
MSTISKKLKRKQVLKKDMEIFEKKVEDAEVKEKIEEIIKIHINSPRWPHNIFDLRESFESLLGDGAGEFLFRILHSGPLPLVDFKKIWGVFAIKEEAILFLQRLISVYGSEIKWADDRTSYPQNWEYGKIEIFESKEEERLLMQINLRLMNGEEIRIEGPYESLLELVCRIIKDSIDIIPVVNQKKIDFKDARDTLKKIKKYVTILNKKIA